MRDQEHMIPALSVQEIVADLEQEFSHLQRQLEPCLQRQQRRAETELHLETAIVQDTRGFVALWTREPPAVS